MHNRWAIIVMSVPEVATKGIMLSAGEKEGGEVELGNGGH